jgi:hypothetical protein
MPSMASPCSATASNPHEVKDVVGAPRQKTADGLDRLGLRGINDIGRAELFGRFQLLRLDVDSHDPGFAGNESTTYGIKPDASGAENDNRVAGAHLRGVQDGDGARDNAAAER